MQSALLRKIKITATIFMFTALTIPTTMHAQVESKTPPLTLTSKPGLERSAMDHSDPLSNTPRPELTPEEKAVYAPLQAILDGVAQRNHEMVRQQLLPGGTATLIRDGKPLQLHFDAFVERFPTTGTTKLEERIHDPLIHIDNDVAVIWAPYEFFFDDKIHHCGTNIISLYRRDGRWLISGIADNSRNICPEK